MPIWPVVARRTARRGQVARDTGRQRDRVLATRGGPPDRVQSSPRGGWEPKDRARRADHTAHGAPGCQAELQPCPVSLRRSKRRGRKGGGFGGRICRELSAPPLRQRICGLDQVERHRDSRPAARWSEAARSRRPIRIYGGAADPVSRVGLPEQLAGERVESPAEQRRHRQVFSPGQPSWAWIAYDMTFLGGDPDSGARSGARGLSQQWEKIWVSS